jgi:hypothetical protein
MRATKRRRIESDDSAKKQLRLDSDDTSDEPVGVNFNDVLFPELRCIIYSFLPLESLGQLAKTCRQNRADLSGQPGGFIWIPQPWKNVIMKMAKGDHWRIVINNEIIHQMLRPTGLFSIPGIGSHIVLKCTKGPLAHTMSLFLKSPRTELLRVTGSASGTHITTLPSSATLKELVDVARLCYMEKKVEKECNFERSTDALAERLEFYMHQGSEQSSLSNQPYEYHGPLDWSMLSEGLCRMNRRSSKQLLQQEIMSNIVKRINVLLGQ